MRDEAGSPGSESDHDEVRVLHVDDEPGFADLTATHLERASDRLSVETATSGSEGLGLLADRPFDCVVSDYDMPEMDGLELLSAVRGDHPDLPFVLFTGKGSEEIASEAISAGVDDYLQKATGTDQYEVLANRVENLAERHRSKRALKSSQRRLSLFVDQSPLGVVQWNADFEVVDMNATAEEILGYEAAELRGRSWEAIVPDSEHDDVAAVVDQLLDGESGVGGVNTNVRKDGERIVCEWHNRVVTDDDGEVLAVFSQFQDVTEREEYQRRLETLISNLPGMVYRCRNEPDWPMEFVGGECEATTGYPASAIREDGDVVWGQDVLHPEDRERAWAVVQSAVEDREPFELEYRIHTADGETRWMWERGRGVFDADGDLQALEGFITDVTERVERERKLREREADLTRENERLDAFASVVSHDLRNPLNVATGHLEMARERRDDEHLAEVAGALDRMESLVEDLLTLARQGDATAAREPVDVGQLAEHCLDTVDLAEASLEVEIDATVLADRGRLAQVFENLFRNAGEHAGDAPTVTVGELEDGFYVADDGPGIPEEEREEVFVAGYSRSRDGSGLGLSIVREVVEAHGWSIAVTDSESGGARFEIRTGES